MSNFGEQPFNEFEEVCHPGQRLTLVFSADLILLKRRVTNKTLKQRYFLAEILKRSHLPPTTLLQVIRDTGVEPAWTEIALPTGT